MTKMGDFLYNSLPEVYRNYDEDGDLKAFLNIQGEVFDGFLEEIDNMETLYDVDNVDERFLPLLAALFGFEYPYDMSVKEQRRFIKAIPQLWRAKGLTGPFTFLAREIFGWSATVASRNTFKLNQGILNDLNHVFIDKASTINVRIYAGEEEEALTRRFENYQRFAELFRPINTYLTTLISFLYYETYDSTQIWLESDEMIITEDLEEDYEEENIETKTWEGIVEFLAEEYDVEVTYDSYTEVIAEILEEVYYSHEIHHEHQDYITELLEEIYSSGEIEYDLEDNLTEEKLDEYEISDLNHAGCILNRKRFKLTNNFRLNLVNHYDIIRENGEEEVVF